MGGEIMARFVERPQLPEVVDAVQLTPDTLDEFLEFTHGRRQPTINLMVWVPGAQENAFTGFWAVEGRTGHLTLMSDIKFRSRYVEWDPV
jgi:hypothetical protein